MRTVLGCLLTAAVLWQGGCSSSPGTAEVSGTVLLDGQPVEEGSIQFIPVEGTKGAGAGGIIKSGNYHIPRDNGVAVGRNRVELRSFRTSGGKVQDPTGAPGVFTDERVQAFPPEYNDNSTVVKEVQSGRNVFDFDVPTK
ncbi:MAG: hypothetical protein L0211_24085 [Planctomycetaceae bacterium]|nr:hypothetical protein [Planctomycetaceae bacterium]